VELMP